MKILGNELQSPEAWDWTERLKVEHASVLSVVPLDDEATAAQARYLEGL